MDGARCIATVYEASSAMCCSCSAYARMTLIDAE
jgi:hypothetical protein